MSLVFLAEDFPPARGGIQTVCYELPLAIQQAGEEVGVVSVCRPGAGEFDVDCPYPIVRVPQGKKLQTGTNMAEGVAELIGEIERPRAIIATKWFPEGLAAISTIKLRKPKLVLMTYGLEFLLRDANPIKWVTKWLLQKYILRQMEIGITISNWTADKLARTAIGRDNIHVVNPGVRARQFQHQQKLQQLKDRLDLPEEAPTILTVGRLVARKGHADVIRALPDVIDSVGPVHYVIVGSGPQEQALKELAESSDIDDCIHFAGNVDDENLPAHYQLCDVFVMPTKKVHDDPMEGFGIVYLEANATGRPVIGTDCGGVSDAIEDGTSGLLLPPEDHEALVDAIVKLIDDDGLRQQLGRDGRKRVESEFTWGRAAGKFLDALDAHEDDG